MRYYLTQLLLFLSPFVFSQDADLIYSTSRFSNNEAVNDSLMHFLKRKFPQQDCNTCLTRTVSRKGYMDVDITVKNTCDKNVRVLGISKTIEGGKTVYRIVWRLFPANYSATFSRSANDLIGGFLVSLILGGGEMNDIDLSMIGKKYDNINAEIGSTQYLQVIEESNRAKALKGNVGENIIEVNSYSQTTDIKVKKGDKVYIHASGWVKTGWFSGYSGPEGKTYVDFWNTEPDLNYGALLVKIENGDWMATGKDTVIKANVSGRLSFVINDTDVSDNYGSFRVYYSINKPLPEIQDLTDVLDRKSSSKSQNQTENNESGNSEVLHSKELNRDVNLRSMLPKKYTGHITNYFFNKRAFCKANLSLSDNGSFRFNGTDNLNVLGDWELTGHEIMQNGKIMYRFSGDAVVDVFTRIKGRPVLKKKKMPMTCVVEIGNNGVHGSYQIVADGRRNRIEKGTIDLK